MKLYQKRKVRRTTLISIGLASLLAGLFSAYYTVSVSGAWLAVVPIIGLGIYKLKKLRVVLMILLGLLLGVWRGSTVFTDLADYQLLYGQKVILTGLVSDDPGFNSERNQTEFTLSGIKINGQKLIGKIQVSVREEPKIGRGDAVQVTGKLKPLKGTSKQAVINMADIKLIKQNTGWLESMRTKFFASVQHSLPEPYGSLGLGYLVGLRATIPNELGEQLKIVGLTHIIAVSGYNLTVIVQAVRRIFAKRSAYQAVLFTSLLLIGFLLVAGGSAPITRAAVICGFSLTAWYYGRQIKPMLLLLLGGGLTAFVNPLYVWGDPGWYLSFLAFGGVLILAPLVFKTLYKKQPGTIAQILIETICAQAMTVPYALFLFGTVSLIAPLANLLVLPLIPIIMLMVFIIGMLGMLAPASAAIMGLVPGSLLTLQVWFIKKLSSVTWAKSEYSISIQEMLLLFLILFLIIVFLIKKTAKSTTVYNSEADYNLL